MSLPRRVSSWDRPVAFVVLTAIMLVIAGGHLYVIGDFTAVSLGLPVWLWVQLGVVVVLLALAWIATDFVSANGGR